VRTPDVAGGEDDTLPFDFTFAEVSADCANLRKLNDDRTRLVILYRIAHIHSDSSISHCGEAHLRRLRTEQFRPAIGFRLSDHDSRDDLFFSLFQVSELNQPITAGGTNRT